MVNQIHAHPQPKSKLHAKFNLFKLTGRQTALICSNISTSQASALLDDLSGTYRLKFVRMET